MDNDIIVEKTLDKHEIGANFQALVPFPATTQQEIAQLVSPPCFSQVECDSTMGLRWTATSVVVRNNHGSFKLYLCQRRNLAMWIPSGDWFYSNQSPQTGQSIADFARQSNKIRTDRSSRYCRPTPYDKPNSAVRKSNNPNQAAKGDLHTGGLHTGTSLEPDLIQIRAEERRLQRQTQKRRTEEKSTSPQVIAQRPTITSNVV